jgi:hypothetical protein
MSAMEERSACTLLRARFQAAGFQIAENVWFEGAGVRFEIDGYDAARRVGYEYITDEAGDTWDVDDAVIGTLAAARARGEYFVLVIAEADAPDPAALGSKADAFLAALPPREGAPKSKPAKAKPPAGKPTKKPAAKKPASKPAAKKPTKKR